MYKLKLIIDFSEGLVQDRNVPLQRKQTVSTLFEFFSFFMILCHGDKNKAIISVKREGTATT